MIKIKITDENRDKINTLISKEEGKAKTRTCTYEDVKNLAEKLESRLDKFNVPKKYRQNSHGSYCQQIGCKSYKKISYSAMSTQIYVIRGVQDWFYIGADRIEIDPASSSSDYCFFPSAEAVECVKRRAENNFRSV